MYFESSHYFSDKKTPIDYILVYNTRNLTLANLSKLEIFVQNLLDVGFKAEIEVFSVNEKIYFIKLHAPDDVIFRYAFVCNVDLACRNDDSQPIIEPPPNFMATPLTKPNPEDEVYQRAQLLVTSEIPKIITSAERIIVIHRLMEKLKFGEESSKYGLNKLLKDKVLCDAFPLHDGSHEWTESGPLNGRQLLAKYWGNFKSWYKEQPLNLIEHYYGTEYAFYFAWFGFYAKMLVPIGILSMLCSLFGLVTVKTRLNRKSQEICSSNVTMCARCHFSVCKFEELKDACLASYITYIFDNPGSIFLAIVTSFWSTVLMEMWQRNEAKLQLQWRVEHLQYEDYVRPEYAEKSTRMTYSHVTRCNEPFVSSKSQFGRFLLSLAAIILLLMSIIFATIGIMVYRIAVTITLMRTFESEFMKHVPIISSVSGAILIAIIIVLSHKLIPEISIKLTNLENHRTQHEYDQAFIYKHYALSFTNAYTILFYIAFFKGRFFTHPGEMSHWTYLGGIGSDLCGPSGCITDLIIYLMIMMFVKLTAKHLLQIIVPNIKIFLKTKKIGHIIIPFYEQEYLLNSVTFQTLHEEYLDIVLQYGYVVFFAAAFPLAPAIAMVNNLIEIRTDASKFLKSYRRPVPNRVPGVGAWFEIMKAVTYLGTIINAVIIAFTSDFVPRQIHGKSEDYSFVKSSLSEFAMNDFVILKSDVNKTCHYPGQRYPPSHEKKYQLTYEFWYVLCMRFFVVILIEHIVLFLNGLLAYAIPDIPAQVIHQLEAKERKNKELREKMYKLQLQESLNKL